MRPEVREASERRRNRSIDGRIPVKDGRKTIFDYDPHLEVRPKVVQDC
jgi:hypothetical protein